MDLTVLPFMVYHASSGANIIACASDERRSWVLLALSGAVGTPQAFSQSKWRGTFLHLTSRHLGQ